MPVFNARRYLNSSIQSVLEQTYSNFEFIIHDDFSSDDSVNIIKSYRDDRIILKTTDVNRGAGYARREALKCAQGDYIAFIDSDDIWYKDKLEECVFLLKTRLDIAAVQSNYKVTENGHEKKIILPKRFITLKDMMVKNHCAMSCMVVRSAVVGDIEMPLIRARQDYAYWIKILENNRTIYTINKTLVEYRKVKGSISSNMFNNIGYNYKMFRKELRYSRTKSLKIVFRNILSKVLG